MKIAIPKTPGEYFQKTEQAVQHAYSGLESCWAYYQRALQCAPQPVEEGGYHVYKPPQTPEEKAELDRSLGFLEKYFELKISEAMFAGFILQAAYMAIRFYSRNTTIPPSCVALVKPTQKDLIRFCIGEECRGIPAGLIVHAGRNQYNHWDDKESHLNTTKIFDALYLEFLNDPLSDLAFDLGNETIPIYAGEILFTALGWHSYEKYLDEMTKLLA